MFFDNRLDPREVVEAISDDESGQERSDVFGAQELAMSQNVTQHVTSEEDLVVVAVCFLYRLSHGRRTAHGVEKEVSTTFARFRRVGLLQGRIWRAGRELDGVIIDLVFD